MSRAALVRPLTLPLLVLGLLLTSIGCKKNRDRPMTDSERNLKALNVFYGRFVGKHKGVSPQNEAEFKKFIKGLKLEELEAFGFTPDNVDTAFISPRDNEPYQIAYRTKSAVPGATGAGMVIWETKGVNGNRFVVDALGKIEEINDDAYRQRLASLGPAK